MIQIHYKLRKAENSLGNELYRESWGKLERELDWELRGGLSRELHNWNK